MCTCLFFQTSPTIATINSENWEKAMLAKDRCQRWAIGIAPDLKVSREEPVCSSECCKFGPFTRLVFYMVKNSLHRMCCSLD